MWIRTTVLVLLALATPLRGAATDSEAPSVVEAARAANLWRPVGPGEGIPAHVAADPFAPGRLFAIWRASDVREVYRRDSGVSSWSFTSHGLEGARPYLLAFHPSRPGTLWAAADPHSIYRSTDAGASWQRRFFSRSGQQAFGLWPVPRGRDAVLLGWFGFSISNAKLFRSRNSGQSWAPIEGARGPVAVLPASATAFALGTDGRVLLASRDSGLTWAPSGALPADADDDGVLAFVALPGRRPVLLVSFAQAGLFRSADQGATWSLVGPAGPGPSSVVATPRALFAAFASGLHQSSDGGATWRPRPSASFPPGPVSLAADSPAGVLYAVSEERGDLSQSRDGGRTWTRVAPRGVQLFVALDFAWHPLDPRVQVLLSGKLTESPGRLDVELLRTGDDGATWRRWPFQAFALDPEDPDVLYAGSDSGVFVTCDGGEMWTQLRSEPAKVLARLGSVLVAGGCGIARSEDDGGHWTEVLPCQVPPSPPLPNGGLLLPSRLVPHPTDPDVIWAEIGEYSTTDVFVSTALYGSFDGGITWERRDLAFPRIALSPGQPDTVWSFAGTVQRSDDRGLTWQLIRYLRSEDTFDLEVDPLDADRIYLVGSFAEVSRDGGAAWDFAFDVARELAAWGTHRQKLVRIFLHPAVPGRIAASPGLGLLLRRAPL